MNEQMSKAIDHTVDGKCSGCGNCCSAILLLSEKEINRIKSYLGRHKEVVLTNRNNVLDNNFKDICPFLTEENRCGIYEVRPEICRRFSCATYKDTSVPPLKHFEKKAINMITTFMPNVICPNAPDLDELNKFYDMQKSRVYGGKK